MARLVSDIAKEIDRVWAKPYFGAKPYIEAMHTMHWPAEPENAKCHMYGVESCDMVLIYALSNMATFRGEDARRIKAELKQTCGVK
jgi:hypothetical protein